MSRRILVCATFVQNTLNARNRTSVIMNWNIRILTNVYSVRYAIIGLSMHTHWPDICAVIKPHRKYVNIVAVYQRTKWHCGPIYGTCIPTLIQHLSRKMNFPVRYAEKCLPKGKRWRYALKTLLCGICPDFTNYFFNHFAGTFVVAYRWGSSLWMQFLSEDISFKRQHVCTSKESSSPWIWREMC